jgi:DNA-binding SARP family transcriptional activator
LHAQNRAEAKSAWRDAATQILRGGYAYILDQDRALAYPLIVAYLSDADPAIAQISQQCVAHLQRVPPPALRIVMLGAFEVWQGARRVDKRVLRKRRAGELLALLLLSPSYSLSFDQIADALWSAKDPAALQTQFHHATSALRRALEPELPDKFPSRYLLVEEGQVTLSMPPGSTIDFQTFEKHCRTEEWDAALAAYRGDLLPDYLYADWAIAPREHLKRLYLRALLVTAHRQMKAGHARETFDACHRILEIEPWQEDAVLLGMHACLAFNDRAGALRLYRDLERTLREELNATPQAALRELYQAVIRGQRDVNRLADYGPPDT